MRGPPLFGGSGRAAPWPVESKPQHGQASDGEVLSEVGVDAGVDVGHVPAQPHPDAEHARHEQAEDEDAHSAATPPHGIDCTEPSSSLMEMNR